MKMGPASKSGRRGLVVVLSTGVLVEGELVGDATVDCDEVEVRVAEGVEEGVGVSIEVECVDEGLWL